VKLLAWNIQHGGGTRLARIVEEISAYDPDVIALTEFRARPGLALCAAMKERGLPHVETTRPAENQNGIAVFSRNPGVTECTWYSKLKRGARGNGFRLDHAFATPSLTPHIISCRYSHAEREAGTSDHSIVIVEIA